MLRSLVKKLKNQTLNDNSDVDTLSTSPPSSDKTTTSSSSSTHSLALTADAHTPTEHQTYLPQCKPQTGNTTTTSCSNTQVQQASEKLLATIAQTTAVDDSGTESDEQEMLLMMNGSIQSEVPTCTKVGNYDSVSTLSAPVSQTSDYCASIVSLYSARSTSPDAHTHYSNDDSNSRDSIGCESGIVLRESDTDTPTPNNKMSVVAVRPPNTIVDKKWRHGSVSVVEAHNTSSIYTGAFQPVSPRRLSDASNLCAENLNDSGHHKRKYHNLVQQNCAVMTQSDTALWCGAVQNTQQQQQQQKLSSVRETLTAARRTPVKLIVMNNVQQERQNVTCDKPVTFVNIPLPSCNNEDELPSSLPRKKCRAFTADCDDTQVSSKSKLAKGLPIIENNVNKRPSLNFDKMRERMVKSGIGQSSCSYSCRAKGKLSSWTRRPRTFAYTSAPHPSPVFDATPNLLPRLNNNNNNNTNPFAEVEEEKNLSDVLT